MLKSSRCTELVFVALGGRYLFRPNNYFKRRDDARYYAQTNQLFRTLGDVGNSVAAFGKSQATSCAIDSDGDAVSTDLCGADTLSQELAKA